ncbi:hypothetical protein NEMIN01_1877 [Nematocida minor]|uniref:uncharacterized protein n=1 Tax=Nematocida minor TaxID=1912983 RepID=UPI00221FD120|nr:uncharacterized protein NEMIN01_1877 [Nematocida minor]KAI5192208.1 hypothetical protein NEMIN01_1877 [Nematocida minor]
MKRGVVLIIYLCSLISGGICKTKGPNRKKCAKIASRKEKEYESALHLRNVYREKADILISKLENENAYETHHHHQQLKNNIEKQKERANESLHRMKNAIYDLNRKLYEDAKNGTEKTKEKCVEHLDALSSEVAKSINALRISCINIMVQNFYTHSTATSMRIVSMARLGCTAAENLMYCFVMVGEKVLSADLERKLLSYCGGSGTKDAYKLFIKSLLADVKSTDVKKIVPLEYLDSNYHILLLDIFNSRALGKRELETIISDFMNMAAGISVDRPTLTVSGLIDAIAMFTVLDPYFYYYDSKKHFMNGIVNTVEYMLNAEEESTRIKNTEDLSNLVRSMASKARRARDEECKPLNLNISEDVYNRIISYLHSETITDVYANEEVNVLTAMHPVYDMLKQVNFSIDSAGPAVSRKEKIILTVDKIKDETASTIDMSDIQCIENAKNITVKCSSRINKRMADRFSNLAHMSITPSPLVEVIRE